MTVYDDVANKVRGRIDYGFLNMFEKQTADDAIQAMWDVLGGNDPHRMTYLEGNWVISHPLDCRMQPGGLLACPVTGYTVPPDGEGDGVFVLRGIAWSRES